MNASTMAVATRPVIVAKQNVKVFVLRSAADLKAMLTRSGGRGNPRSAALARAVNSITEKILADSDAGSPRCCGCCGRAMLFEGCDVAMALIVSAAGVLTTMAFGVCADCSPEATTAMRNALAAIRPTLPPQSKISTPGARP